jgi:hypothetical protein
MNACKGNCCDPVVMEVSPQEIVEAYINSKTGLRGVRDIEEVQKMYKLLTFKGMSRISPMEKGIYEDGKMMHMYECSNFDYITRQCKDYDNRMNICRKYGENKCDYDGCQKSVNA